MSTAPIDLGVDAAYRHYPKQVAPGAALVTDGAELKWYELHPAQAPVPDAVSALARAFLVRTPLEAKGLGCVIFHRCGDSFYFLIVCTWRNANELWQTVYYKDATMTDFALFPRDGEHKATLCVWELVPVMHEQAAWCRFLESPRDATALAAWRAALCRGAA